MDVITGCWRNETRQDETETRLEEKHRERRGGDWRYYCMRDTLPLVTDCISGWLLPPPADSEDVY